MNSSKFLQRFSGCFMALTMLIVTLPSQAGLLELSLSDSDAQVGDSVTVDVVLDSPFADFTGGSLFGFGLNLDFNNTVLALTDVTMGALWDDMSPFALNADVAGLSNDPLFGVVMDEGQSSLLLFQLTFNVLSSGMTGLNLASDPDFAGESGLFYSDAFFEPVRTDVSSSLDVLLGQTSVEVPEPSILLLILMSLPLLIKRRRS